MADNFIITRGLGSRLLITEGYGSSARPVPNVESTDLIALYYLKQMNFIGNIFTPGTITGAPALPASDLVSAAVQIPFLVAAAAVRVPLAEDPDPDKTIANYYLKQMNFMGNVIED